MFGKKSWVTLTSCLVLAGRAPGIATGAEVAFDRYASLNGDVNADQDRDLSDVISILSWLYLGGPGPAPLACQLQAPDLENGDTNGDQALDMSDAVALLGWLFSGGPEPRGACGLEPEGQGARRSNVLRIISPSARYRGLTYGEWSAEWWRWAINIPADAHPFFDPAACDRGQRGPVWFLSGSFGDPQTRECVIPLGKAILFPVLNAECSTVEPPPFFGSNEAELRQCAHDFMSGASGLSASIEGQPVRGLERFRVDSPLFGVNYPEINILGAAGPGSALSVSDGVWILLAPPEEGTYTIRFSGTIPGASLDMTFVLHIVDQSDPRVVPVDDRVAGKTYGDWGAEWWKLVYATPVSESPIVASSPGCVPQPHGPVHFLFGTTGGAADRTCNVPVGKRIFFPLLNSFNDFPCPDAAFAPAPGQSLEDFLKTGVDFVFSNLVTSLVADLDGVPIPNLASYRATSRLESFTADPSQIAFDPCVTGGKQVGVSDGYWLLLEPLSPGNHTLHFASAVDFFGTPFSLDVTYHLTVSR